MVKRDGASADMGVNDPGFWAVMLVKPALYGIAIPILYQLCKKLGGFRFCSSVLRDLVGGI